MINIEASDKEEIISDESSSESKNNCYDSDEDNGEEDIYSSECTMSEVEEKDISDSEIEVDSKDTESMSAADKEKIKVLITAGKAWR